MCSDIQTLPGMELPALALFELNSCRPTLSDPTTGWIADTADVVGNVSIGRDVGIWFGAVIRGDNDPITLGQGTNIQDGVILHSDPGAPLTIGKNCTIGHNAIVHGCQIGDGSLVGMGATILNHAKVGKGCLVGANALITEGKQFPDHSLIVGSPAKAVKTLDEKTVQSLLETAAKYVKNAQRFRLGLKKVEH